MATQVIDGRLKSGFWHNGRTIYYLDDHGKDVSFERWRVCGYYAPHYAETIFHDTEAEHFLFIESRKQHCYDDYMEFRRNHESLDRLYDKR